MFVPKRSNFINLEYQNKRAVNVVKIIITLCIFSEPFLQSTDQSGSFLAYLAGKLSLVASSLLYYQYLTMILMIKIFCIIIDIRV